MSALRWLRYPVLSWRARRLAVASAAPMPVVGVPAGRVRAECVGGAPAPWDPPDDVEDYDPRAGRGNGGGCR